MTILTGRELRELLKKSVFEAEVRTCFATFCMPLDTDKFFENLEPDWDILDYIGWQEGTFMAQLDDPTPLYYYWGMDSSLSDPAGQRASIQHAISTPEVTTVIAQALFMWCKSLIGGPYGAQAIDLMYRKGKTND